MKKWLDKYNAPKAQNGIEGTMGGLTDKGFNYNGAWGGPSMQMGGTLQPPMAGADQTVPMYQMGGYVYPTTFVPQAEMGASLPGSVGFTYARTQGIPSEGPYGKKTVPSAQKGNKQEPSSLDLAKIKARMALESHFGNPSARRMTTSYPQDLLFKLNAGPDKGKMGRGTHWMGTIDNYIVPNIQEGSDGKLFFNQNASPLDREAMRFETPEEALMFAENYKEVAPMSRKKYVNGGEMQFYQNGLDWTPRNISRNGSVVKDNNGYWNPDNWGKVVEIDSPNITMKGVNQDLIGVSDTGDVQYMTPGNDYTFDGNRVKEYPVAKYGVNQQDEKTVQHLDQLLNFTNKPKAKNGWLSKYE